MFKGDDIVDHCGLFFLIDGLRSMLMKLHKSISNSVFIGMLICKTQTLQCVFCTLSYLGNQFTLVVESPVKSGFAASGALTGL